MSQPHPHGHSIHRLSRHLFSVPTTPSRNCTISTYDATAIKNVVASCTAIVIKDLTVPGNTTLDLSKVCAAYVGSAD